MTFQRIATAGSGFNVTARWIAVVVALVLGACGSDDPGVLLNAAKSQHEKGDRNAAVLQLKSSLQDNPEHVESRLFLGLLYNEMGDYRGAEKELRRALELGAEPARVLPPLAKALTLQGEPRKVLTEISADGLQDPGAAAAVLAARGVAHLVLREPSDAKSSFDKALALMPSSVDGHLGRARLLASERKLDEGLREVQLALDTSPKDADALMFRADLLRALGRRDEARTAYKTVVDTYPDHVNGRFALISLAVGANAFDEASEHLAAVRKVAPGNAMASYFQALIDFRKGDFKAARDAVGAVLKVAPNHLPSVLLGGAVEFALGSQELAQARLKFVLDRAPGNLYARRLLIASYTRAGQTHKALELLDPLLKQGVKDAAVLALAGEIQMQLNDYEKARFYFEQAAALDPKNSAMRTGLGLSRLAAGEVDLATADLESASQLDSTRHHADVLLVSTYLQRGQFDQALKAAQSLASKQPANPMSHNLLAAAYIGKKDLPAAKRSLEKALQLQPGYVPAAANLAQLDLQAGDKRAARKRFETIIAKDAGNVQAYVALASLGSRIDATPKEIQQWLETARRESPGTIQPLVMLARFYFQSGEPSKALEVVDKAIIAAPEKPEVLELAGQVQLSAGEKNRALASFSKWLAVQPMSAVAHYRMATAQTANDDLNGAIGSLRKALEHRAQFPEAQVLLAELQARLGRPAEALKAAAQLQAQNVKSPLGWIVEGDVHMLDKKYAAAVKAYERAFAMGRSGATVMKLHASLAAEGRAAEGESRLKEWLKQKPDDLSTRLYLAELHLKAARYKEAIQSYEILLSKDPDNLVVLNNLAWCYHQTKDKRAVETAEKALKRKPESPAVIDTLGWILVQSGDVPRGVELLKKASSLVPKAPEIRYHYAYGLAKSGNAFRAREELERLLADFPVFSESNEAKALLTSLKQQASAK